MSILFHDGFDHYGTGNIPVTWATNGGFVASGYKQPTQTLSLHTNYAKVPANISGADAAYGISLNSSNQPNQVWISRNIEVWADRIVVGFALKVNAVPSSQLKVFEFTPDYNFIVQPDLYVKAFGITTKFQVEVGIWYFYEMQIDRITGKATAWCANNKIVEVTTDAFLIESWHIMASCPVGSTAQNNIVNVDDIYVLDGSGTTHTSRLGRSNSVLRVPKATVEAGFVASSGTNHAATATLAPSATPYVASGEAVRDLYSNPANLNSTKRIHAVSVVLNAMKEEPDPITVAPILKSGTTVAEGDDFTLRASMYTGSSQVFEFDPATGLEWTKDAVLAGAWGAKTIIGTFEAFPTETGDMSGTTSATTVAVADSSGITIYEDS